MTAASYWSLLAPAIETAEKSGLYGKDGQYAFVPVSIGFLAGAVFVYSADVLMTYLGYDSGNVSDFFLSGQKESKTEYDNHNITNNGSSVKRRDSDDTLINIVQRKKKSSVEDGTLKRTENDEKDNIKADWKKIFLLIVAITVHNIPEGLAVGVGFGAIGKSPSATFENARNLAIGIGIQNFPEGLAVSLPLVGSGLSPLKSFWYGQLSGMVEPIAGIFGAFAVVLAEPMLPYALAFAAGAMIYVVVDDIVPEAQTSGNGRLASWCTILGFIVMMSLDVGLG
ncbi:Zinc transporter ZIP11 [Paramuricea clavata]|nr:Zinc transporter ZIP11 [Paramuricea clavata]